MPLEMVLEQVDDNFLKNQDKIGCYLLETCSNLYTFYPKKKKNKKKEGKTGTLIWLLLLSNLMIMNGSAVITVNALG